MPRAPYHSVPLPAASHSSSASPAGIRLCPRIRPSVRSSVSVCFRLCPTACGSSYGRPQHARCRPPALTHARRLGRNAAGQRRTRVADERGRRKPTDVAPAPSGRPRDRPKCPEAARAVGTARKALRASVGTETRARRDLSETIRDHYRFCSCRCRRPRRVLGPRPSVVLRSVGRQRHDGPGPGSSHYTACSDEAYFVRRM